MLLWTFPLPNPAPQLEPSTPDRQCTLPPPAHDPISPRGLLLPRALKRSAHRNPPGPPSARNEPKCPRPMLETNGINRRKSRTGSQKRQSCQAHPRRTRRRTNRAPDPTEAWPPPLQRTRRAPAASFPKRNGRIGVTPSQKTTYGRISRRTRWRTEPRTWQPRNRPAPTSSGKPPGSPVRLTLSCDHASESRNESVDLTQVPIISERALLAISAPEGAPEAHEPLPPRGFPSSPHR